MFFSVFSILEFILLIVNGFAIINRERVLNKYLKNRSVGFSSNTDGSIILRLTHLILSIQTVLRSNSLLKTNSLYMTTFSPSYNSEYCYNCFQSCIWLAMGSDNDQQLIYCYNKGCGKKFNPDENNEGLSYMLANINFYPFSNH